MSMVFLTLLGATACAAEPRLDTKVGLEAVYYLRTTDRGLVVRKADERSPLLLRIASVTADENTLLYELRYLGMRAGRHNLFDYLARPDGAALDLPPLMVEVSESLPADHDGSLDPLAVRSTATVAPYRQIVQAVLIVWLAATGIWMVRQRLRRPRPSVVVPLTSLTLADQLQPLVEAAIAGRLDVTGQARLEMLLLSHWRTSLGLDSLTTEAALGKIRSDPQAGELLRALEGWLHARPGTRSVDVAAMLRPYGQSPAVSEAIP